MSWSSPRVHRSRRNRSAESRVSRRRRASTAPRCPVSASRWPRCVLVLHVVVERREASSHAAHATVVACYNASRWRDGVSAFELLPGDRPSRRTRGPPPAGRLRAGDHLRRGRGRRWPQLRPSRRHLAARRRPGWRTGRGVPPAGPSPADLVARDRRSGARGDRRGPADCRGRRCRARHRRRTSRGRDGGAAGPAFAAAIVSLARRRPDRGLDRRPGRHGAR